MSAQLQAYIARRNADTVFIANIESVPAIENLDEILQLPGLDGVFIGPHDLSCSLGIPEQYDHPVFIETVTTLIQKARAKKISVGIHFSEEPERQIYWASVGVNIIVHSSDLAMFKQRFQSDLQTIRSALADPSAMNQDKTPVI